MFRTAHELMYGRRLDKKESKRSDSNDPQATLDHVLRKLDEWSHPIFLDSLSITAQILSAPPRSVQSPNLYNSLTYTYTPHSVIGFSRFLRENITTFNPTYGTSFEDALLFSQFRESADLQYQVFKGTHKGRAYLEIRGGMVRLGEEMHKNQLISARYDFRI